MLARSFGFRWRLSVSLVASLALVAPLAPVRSAQAQEMTVAKARETFREGIAHEAAGKWEAALAAFKAVAVVKPTPQVRYHIGYCQEKLGQFVDALGSYRLALHEAIESKAKDAEKATRERLTILEPKIPKLTIERGDGAQVAEVTMDGVTLGATSVGSEIPANPGPHVITATAPRRKAFRAEFTLEESESKTLTLVLKKDAEPVAEVPNEPMKPTPTDAPPPPAGTSKLKIAGFVVGGLGLVSLGVSAGFFGVRAGAISDLDKVCGSDRKNCPASAASTRDSGQTASTISTATFIGGLGALAVGATLILVAPSSKKPAPTVGLALGGPGDLGGATLAGTF
jgi:hypothetical protein